MKFYYTGPLAATYMAREFGVKFRCSEGKYELKPLSQAFYYEDSKGTYRGVKTDRAYIHPDSLPVFEPKMMDMVDYYKLLLGATGPDSELVQMRTDTALGKHSMRNSLYHWKIIQRNGKPLFWPIIEESSE